ncbi:hypothetical protein GYMLUDRAFT_721800 [Collybiopsis luxurians FD-317 M1]|nr:hypothetical protein GYMLUDRAFT_721800 [Collybiopsis luxurians FD-317 M1]
MMLSTFFTLFCVVLSLFEVGWSDEAHPIVSFLDSLPATQRDIFNYGMKGLDINWGGPGTFIFGSVRYSAWYAVGLLARNENDDAKDANDLIKSVISYQFTDPSKIWFGTFKDAPDSPNPGDTWAPEIYTSYDPNQGLFVGTSFIIILEEFARLLDPDVEDLVKKSLYNATIGDGYRNGGLNGDNCEFKRKI